MATPMRSGQRQPTGCVATAAGCGIAAVALFLGMAGLLAMADGKTGAGVFLIFLACFVLVGGVATGAALKSQRTQQLRQLQAIQSTEVARYHAMNPREFEQAIAFLCHRDGCRDAQVVGGAGDLGADVIATAPDGRRIVIQCKRYGPINKVGSQDMQRFGGTCYTVHGAHVAAVVTTSTFTKPAADYALHSRIRLVDNYALAAWATRTGPAPWM